MVTSNPANAAFHISVIKALGRESIEAIGESLSLRTGNANFKCFKSLTRSLTFLTRIVEIAKSGLENLGADRPDLFVRSFRVSVIKALGRESIGAIGESLCL
jgi:hypothetical protein